MDNNCERIRCVLRERRIELSLTQKEVAERAGIKLQQYQKLKGGERNVTTASFDVVCRVREKKRTVNEEERLQTRISYQYLIRCDNNDYCGNVCMTL